MYAINGASFTGRGGTVYTANVATDFPPSDVGLASQYGWIQLNVSQWPGLLDVPEFGVSTQPGAMNTVKLFQSNIPMVIAATGSIGNNGALTLTTALPTGFMNGPTYQYFPAGAIATSSAAGWYYTLMTSTTAGTIYNNTYSTGMPFIPSAAALVPFVTTGPGAYTGVTSAVTALSFTLPGNFMGPNGFMYVTPLFGFNASTNNKTCVIKVGSSTIFSLVEATTGVKSYQGETQWSNQGATGAQVTNTGGASGTSTTAQSYTAIDTTTAQTVTVVLTAAVATDWISVDSFSAVVTPG
jgi:hypothetical protein